MIRRFSEDVDLTYDIRDIVPDLIGNSAEPLPANRSQEKRWSAEIRRRLAEWTRNTAAPYLAEALGAVEPGGTVRIDDADLFVRYAPLNEGTAYVRPEVKLEFGARSTGEPSARMPVTLARVATPQPPARWVSGWNAKGSGLACRAKQSRISGRSRPPAAALCAGRKTRVGKDDERLERHRSGRRCRTRLRGALNGAAHRPDTAAARRGEGYRLDTLEKVLRLLELLDEIAQDPVLSQRLALKGGTALNVFYLDLDRLSVDIDLNYVGALDLAAMERERPEVDAAVDRLFASHGTVSAAGPPGTQEASGSRATRSALGGNASLELDLNYMARQPLFGAVRMESRILGRVGTGAFSFSISTRSWPGRSWRCSTGVLRAICSMYGASSRSRGSIGAGSRPPSWRSAPAELAQPRASHRTRSPVRRAGQPALYP